MTKAIRYPRIHDVGNSHDILVTFTDGEEPRRFCGRTWCTGCDLPALVIGDMKAAGNAVACGAVMQSLREWRGERVDAPAEHRDAMLKMMWL